MINARIVPQQGMKNFFIDTGAPVTGYFTTNAKDFFALLAMTVKIYLQFYP
jgi:hypothetical protein